MATSRRRAPSSHPVNRALIDEAPLGVRIADGVTGIARLEKSNNELLERVIGLEKTILANQQTVMSQLPGPAQTPGEAPKIAEAAEG